MAIDLPASVAAKVLLLNEMIVQKIRPSELARRMGTTAQEVNRLIAWCFDYVVQRRR